MSCLGRAQKFSTGFKPGEERGWSQYILILKAFTGQQCSNVLWCMWWSGTHISWHISLSQFNPKWMNIVLYITRVYFFWLRQFKLYGNLVPIESSIQLDFRKVMVKVLTVTVFGGWAEGALHQPYCFHRLSNDAKTCSFLLGAPRPTLMSPLPPFPFPTEAPPC